MNITTDDIIIMPTNMPDITLFVANVDVLSYEFFGNGRIIINATWDVVSTEHESEVNYLTCISTAPLSAKESRYSCIDTEVS